GKLDVFKNLKEHPDPNDPQHFCNSETSCTFNEQWIRNNIYFAGDDPPWDPPDEDDPPNDTNEWKWRVISEYRGEHESNWRTIGGAIEEISIDLISPEDEEDLEVENDQVVIQFEWTPTPETNLIDHYKVYYYKPNDPDFNWWSEEIYTTNIEHIIPIEDADDFDFWDDGPIIISWKVIGYIDNLGFEEEIESEWRNINIRNDDR
ncbi:MAG: hypothetical protein U9M89_00995, partial [Patescibacteria group bacterium]|nr:hypothetical protein [Patescibacteria group bacterium]